MFLEIMIEVLSTRCTGYLASKRNKREKTENIQTFRLDHYFFIWFVRIIELNIKVDEDVSLQKIDSPIDLLVLFDSPVVLLVFLELWGLKDFEEE